MDLLDDLITYENENTKLDFKLIEYNRNITVDLLKDVMSMANANVTGDRFIIIGMKPTPKSRGVNGINTITDAANLQQVIIENIEPAIHIDYQPYMYQEKMLGIIKIYNCDAKPYLMKKDFTSGKQSLKKGDSFIRMGTTQMRLLRDNYEQIYKERYSKAEFSGDLQFSFMKNEHITELHINPINPEYIKLPSDIKKAKIESIIKTKENEIEKLKKLGIAKSENDLDMRSMLSIASANLRGGGIPYEDRSLKNLRENLQNVHSTYYDHDYHYLFEQNSQKLNFYLKNIGLSYLKDVKVILKIERIDGFMMATNIPRDPEQSTPIITNFRYPQVEKNDNFYEVNSDLGDVKQQLSIKVFFESLRMLFKPSTAGKQINLRFYLYATNLSLPIEKILVIRIGEIKSLPTENYIT